MFVIAMLLSIVPSESNGLERHRRDPQRRLSSSDGTVPAVIDDMFLEKSMEQQRQDSPRFGVDGLKAESGEDSRYVTVEDGEEGRLVVHSTESSSTTQGSFTEALPEVEVVAPVSTSEEVEELFNPIDKADSETDADDDPDDDPDADADTDGGVHIELYVVAPSSASLSDTDMAEKKTNKEKIGGVFKTSASDTQMITKKTKMKGSAKGDDEDSAETKDEKEKDSKDEKEKDSKDSGKDTYKGKKKMKMKMKEEKGTKKDGTTKDRDADDDTDGKGKDKKTKRKRITIPPAATPTLSSAPSVSPVPTVTISAAPVIPTPSPRKFGWTVAETRSLRFRYTCLYSTGCEFRS